MKKFINTGKVITLFSLLASSTASLYPMRVEFEIEFDGTHIHTTSPGYFIGNFVVNFLLNNLFAESMNPWISQELVNKLHEAKQKHPYAMMASSLGLTTVAAKCNADGERFLAEASGQTECNYLRIAPRLYKRWNTLCRPAYNQKTGQLEGISAPILAAYGAGLRLAGLGLNYVANLVTPSLKTPAVIHKFLEIEPNSPKTQNIDIDALFNTVVVPLGKNQLVSILLGLANVKKPVAQPTAQRYSVMRKAGNGNYIVVPTNS